MPLVALLVLLAAAPAPARAFTSLAVVNAVVHSADPHATISRTTPFEAFVIENGRFMIVGRTGPIRDYALNRGIPVTDMHGAIIIPGLIDSHAHLLGLGLAQQAADLVGCRSVAEVRQRLRAYLDSHAEFDPKHDWLFGMGWDQNLWGTSAFPTAADLDADQSLAAVSIALVRVDVHAAWVNGRLLAALPSPLPTFVPGGEIVRGGANGAPTGVFVDNAMDILLQAAPVPSQAKLVDAVKQAIRTCNSHGITSVHEAGIGAQVIDLYKHMINRGEFNIRNYAMFSCDARNTFCDFKPVHQYGDNHLTVRSVKLYLDGALGSWGAAMLANYTDKSTTNGFLRMDPADLPAVVDQWVDAGFQVCAHAIGDRANRIAIDAFEQAINRLGRHADLRLRLEHAQHLTLDDIKRVGVLGILPSVQPTHATSDKAYAVERLGLERIQGSYAWRKLLDAGVLALPLGSDFPVERVNPFVGMYAAVTRQDEHGEPPGGWFADERLSRLEALRGFTYDGAYASFQEHELGAIAPGRRGDFVVIDRDITVVSDEALKDTKVMATAIGGELVYVADGLTTLDDVADRLRSQRRDEL